MTRQPADRITCYRAWPPAGPHSHSPCLRRPRPHRMRRCDKPQASDQVVAVHHGDAGSGIDACKLINSDDIAKLLGKPVDGRSIGADPTHPPAPGRTGTPMSRSRWRSAIQNGRQRHAAPGPARLPRRGHARPGRDAVPEQRHGRVPRGRSLEHRAGRGARADGTGCRQHGAVDLARKIGSQLPQ